MFLEVTELFAPYFFIALDLGETEVCAHILRNYFFWTK